MGGQGMIPNNPEEVRGRNGPGGGDAPDSTEQAREVLDGKKTFGEAVREHARVQDQKAAEPSPKPDER